MAAWRMSSAITPQAERDSADDLRRAFGSFSLTSGCVNLSLEEMVTNKSINSTSLHRYPSPDRPAYSPSRPMTVFRRLVGNNAVDIGYQADLAIDRPTDRVNSGATQITTIGVRLCKRHQSSSRQWQYLVWQVALRATQSVALQAQALALLPQKFSALIAQARCLPVQLLACFATTQASTAAVKVDTRAHHGRINSGNRRWGHTPAAVFAF